MPEEYMESDLIIPGKEDSDVAVATPEEEELEIDIVNDTPEDDRRPPRNETQQAEPVNEDDELKGYSESVQKRIKRLKYEFHEERRQKERADRERSEALTYASALQQQIEQYRQQNEASQRALIHTSAKQKGSELEAAKKMLKEAYEAGDTDKMAEAQESISVLANEKRVLDSYTPPNPSSVSYLQPATPQEVQQPVASRPAQPQASAKAVLWKENNPWFGDDMTLTGYAIDIHNKLINAGVDAESDQYYEAIDSAVNKFRKSIPGQAEAKPAQTQSTKPKNGVVVSSSRTPSGKTRTTVQLTESALAVAKRLGITPQQYAKELLKQQKENQ